ncbi:hypothetical protein E2320_000309 [Naja naja]|nr:hypothetical protein E2320_000309 [Naja naja]
MGTLEGNPVQVAKSRMGPGVLRGNFISLLSLEGELPKSAPWWVVLLTLNKRTNRSPNTSSFHFTPPLGCMSKVQLHLHFARPCMYFEEMARAVHSFSPIKL